MSATNPQPSASEAGQYTCDRCHRAYIIRTDGKDGLCPHCATPATTGKLTELPYAPFDFNYDAIDHTKAGANDVRVGRFLSRAVDTETYRVGVKDHRFFRAIHYTSTTGEPMNRICLVETPGNYNNQDHLSAIHKVCMLLHVGEETIRERMESAKHLEACSK